MGAKSQSDVLRTLSALVKDVADAIDRGVTVEEIAHAIVALEPTRSDTTRRVR